MPVYVGTAGCTERAQRVKAGHVKDQTHIVSLQDSAEEVRSGIFQWLEAIAMGQAQEVQHYLLPGRAEAGPACVEVVEQHGESLRPSLLQANLCLGLRLLHPTVQQGSRGAKAIRDILEQMQLR